SDPCGRGHRSCPDRYRYHGRDDASRGVHPVRSAGHSVSWLTLHAQQIVGLVDHAAVFRSVLNLNGVTDATQAQALDACLVVARRPFTLLTRVTLTVLAMVRGSPRRSCHAWLQRSTEPAWPSDP